MKTLALSRVAEDGSVEERLELSVLSGKDPLALLLEVAEDLCIHEAPDGTRRIPASDIRPFLLPRLDELLDPDNEELRFVLSVDGEEGVNEHTIRIAVAKGVWPTNGSVTLEAAVLAVKLAALARVAAKNGESILIDWRQG